MIDLARILADINEIILIDYIDGRRKRADHTLKVTKFRDGKTKAGTYRVWMTARDESGINKTYSFARIRSVVNLSTGEVFDRPSKWGEQVITKYEGIAPSFWPFEYARTTKIPWNFDPNTFPVFENFAFGIGRGHLPEFDIKLEEIPPERGTKKKRPAAYTIGDPQRLCFERGSIYHMPPLTGELARSSWAVQKEFLDCTVQIMEQLVGDGERVRFRRKDHGTGDITEHTVFNQVFEAYLRTGDLNCLK